jgi:hypothetical protein
MARHTARASLVMSLAALCATPTVGLMATVTKRSARRAGDPTDDADLLLDADPARLAPVHGKLAGIYNGVSIV